MKQGSSLVDMAIELERQLSSRKDYVAPQGKIRALVEATSKEVRIDGVNGEPMAITDFAHGQIAGQLEIPKKYYDRMLVDQPELLAENVNVWLREDSESRRMVRTLDGKIRAFLSDKYRPLDNYDLLNTTLPVLKNAGSVIVSNAVTEKRLYLKAILPELCDEVEEHLTLGQGNHQLRKDTIVAAVTISNSEIGAGGVRIDAGFYKTRCTNLAIFSEGTLKKYHVGRAAGGSLDDAVEYFTDETRKADDTAFWMKVRDVVAGAFNADLFHAQVRKMQAAARDEIKSQDLTKVVEVTRKVFSLSEGVQNGILTHLIRDMDLTRWGLLNAVTRTAEDVKSYDDATDLERIGGKILDLPASDWKEISEAA